MVRSEIRFLTWLSCARGRPVPYSPQPPSPETWGAKRFWWHARGPNFARAMRQERPRTAGPRMQMRTQWGRVRSAPELTAPDACVRSDPARS